MIQHERADLLADLFVTVGELRVSPWLTAPGMEDEQLGRRGLSASQPMAERD